MAKELRIDPATVKLANATRAEFERAMGWVASAPVMQSFDIPYEKGVSKALVMADCVAWCAKNRD